MRDFNPPNELCECAKLRQALKNGCGCLQLGRVGAWPSFKARGLRRPPGGKIELRLRLEVDVLSLGAFLENLHFQ